MVGARQASGTAARVLVALAVAAAAGAAAPSSSAAAGTGAGNRIGELRVVEEAGRTTIVAIGSEAPIFTVFRLDDPPRVVVDIAGGETTGLRAPIAVDNGLVNSVDAVTYGGKGGAPRTARLTVSFSSKGSYDVRAEGTQVIVTITGLGGPAEPKVTTVAAAEVAAAKKDADAAKRDAAAAKASADAARRDAAAAEASAAKDVASAKASAAKDVAIVKDAAAKDVATVKDAAAKDVATAKDAAAKDVADAKAAAARAGAEVKAAEAKAAEALKKVEALEREVRESEAARDAAGARVKTLEAERTAALAKAADADKGATAAAARADKAEKAAARAADEHARALAAAEARLSAAEAAKSRALADARASTAKAVEVVKVAAAVLAGERDKVKGLEKSLEAARGEATRLGDEAARARADRDGAAKAADEARKAKTAAEKAVAELKTKAGGLEKDLAAAREKETAAAAAAAKDADDAKKRTAAATAAAKARALEEALAKVGADLGAKEKDLAARADEMGAKEKTLAALAATLGERDAAVARARKEVEARVAAVAKKETDLGAREAELRAAETRLAAERAAVDEARTAAEAEIARLAGAKDAHDKGAAAALAKLDKARAAAEAAAKSAESERAAASKSALAAAGARAKEEDLTAKAATARAREEELAHKAAADRAREEDALKLAAAKRAGEEAAGRAAEAKRTESEAAAKKADLERARAEAAARTAAADKARAEEAAAAARAAGAAAASDRKAAEDAAAKALERRKAADAEAVAAEARLRAAEKAAAGAEKAAGDAAAKMRALGAALAEARGEADKARAEADKVRGDAAAAKADADTARAEAEKMKADAGKATAAAEAERKAVAAAKGAAEKARLAAEAEKASAEKARAAADAEKAATEKLRKEYEAKLASAIAAAKAPPPAAAPPAPAPTVAADKPAGLVKVKDVSFEDLADHSRVTIAFDGGAVPADYAVHAEGRLLVLDLPGARVPKGLERAVDTSAFPSAVLMVSSYNAATDRVRVEVTLREGVLHRVKKEGGTLVWDFNKVADDTALAAAPAAAAAPGPAPAPAPGAPPTMSPSDRPTSITGHAAPVPATTIALPGTEVAGFATAPPVYESGVMAAKRKYTGTPIDLDFKDADIHNLLRAIAEVGRVNIIASEEVSGTVTIRMKNVPWDQALDVILKSKKLGMIREDSIIRVMPIDDVRKEFEEAAEMALGKAKALPLHVRLVPVSFASAKDLVPKVADVLTERGRVEFDERTNLLIVKDIEANLDAAEELVRSLDTETPQVLIEARLVEANNDFTREVGVQWGGDSALTSAYGNATGLVFPSDILVAGGAGDTRTDGLTPSATGTPNPNFLVNLPAAVTEGSGGALGITLGSLNRAFNLSLRLSALEENGTIRIVSAPKIATLDNKEAEISQGTDIPISVVSAAGTNVQFVSARLSLKVKPHITADGSVIMKIDITNDFPDFARITGRGDPTIRKKEAHTELLVKDGETAVIGGIFTRTTTINTSEVPWFGKIPFIGWFFRKTKETDSRTELLVFITPRIINRSATIAAKTGPGDAAVLEPGK